MTKIDDGLENFIEDALGSVTSQTRLISESYERHGDEMVLIERSDQAGLRGLLELRAAIRASEIQHEIDANSPELGAAGRPLVVPLAEAERFQRYVGLSPSRARKLHRTEGFPIRARGKGARRSYYVVLTEVEQWWLRQPPE